MGQRVRSSPSWTMSFVCQTTPHFGSTSREVSYSVPPYHTGKYRKCKSPIYPFLFFHLRGENPLLFCDI